MKSKIILACLAITAVAAIFFSTTKEARVNNTTPVEKKAFRDYWQKGKAELNHYRIKQARYGELHKGYEVLIFVTEPFLKDKQVKLDGNWRKGALQVLKLNRVRRFTTGIYDYSMMTSVFKPIDVSKYSHSLKTTLTSQDWCGHTFLQLNLKGSNYRAQSFSYFESEGDEEFSVEKALLEDEILNTIRISPNLLAVGEVELIPSSVVLRLRHTKARVVRALAKKQKYTGREFRGKDLIEYSISYNDKKRTMSVFYESKHPHLIAGYKDTYRSGWGAKAKELTTTAVLTKTYMSSYWQQNSNKHVDLRSKLRLKKEL